MRAGNKLYESAEDLPADIPIFPLSGALLLPGGNMPLNIFEPRYMAMTDHALKNDRLIGMIQPDISQETNNNSSLLYKIGCLGRITGFQETGDGRYMINLSGICRFEILNELDSDTNFKQASIKVNSDDLLNEQSAIDNSKAINRDLLVDTFRKYLVANNMETDWEAVEQSDDETLVTALCMMSPYGPAEKQALLEAKDLFTRAETLVALTEIALAKSSEDPENSLQ